MPLKSLNGTWWETEVLNASQPWDSAPTGLEVFHRADLMVIALYALVLTASLSANTLLIYVVVKFQYMRSLNGSWWETELPNASQPWEAAPTGLKVFHRADLMVIALYALVLTASLSANTLLIYVVVKFQYMRSVTNIFLVNLSVADLLVTLFCMPVQIAKAVTLLWYFGEVMCKTVNFLQGVAVASSVFTITAMSVDRYLAITQSLRQPWMPSRRGACLLLGVLWLVALAIFAPLLVVAAVEREVVPLLARTENGSILVERSIEFCTEKWPNTINKELFGAFSFILVYAVPGCIVVVSYSLMGRRLCSVLPPFDQTEGSANSQQRLRLVRERKRVAWILLLLAVLFALCWLPYNILQLLIDVNVVRVDSGALLLPYTLLLGHTNSAINPIVYCLMTRNFRRSLRKLLCHDPGNIHSSTHFHMQGLRQKSNTSSMRTCTTVTFRSSNRSGRAAPSPCLQHGKVSRAARRDRSQARAAQFL